MENLYNSVKNRPVRAVVSAYDYKDPKLQEDFTYDPHSYIITLMLTCVATAWKIYRPEDTTVLYLNTSMERWYKKAVSWGYLGFDEYQFIDFEYYRSVFDIKGNHWSWPKIVSALLQTGPYCLLDWDVFLEKRILFESEILTYKPYDFAKGHNCYAIAKKYGLWTGENMKMEGINAGFIYYPDVNLSTFLNTVILQFFSRDTKEDWSATQVMEEVFINQVLKMFNIPRKYVEWSTKLNSNTGPCHWIEEKHQDPEKAIETLKAYLKVLRKTRPAILKTV